MGFLVFSSVLCSSFICCSSLGAEVSSCRCCGTLHYESVARNIEKSRDAPAPSASAEELAGRLASARHEASAAAAMDVLCALPGAFRCAVVGSGAVANHLLNRSSSHSDLPSCHVQHVW